MAEVTLVFWRDIPAQVIVGKGRRAAKVQLSERFETGIDRAAMKSGAKDGDAYLADWRKVADGPRDGEAADIAGEIAQELETRYDDTRLKTLISNGGWEPQE